MAEKFMNGIGRELRYVEYKLRKKHSEWDKDRKKSKQNQADKKYPSMKEFTSSEQVPTEFSDTLPTDKNEEALQVQVALAISKNEMDEAKRQEESDRIRLELALKESKAAMAETEAKIKLKQQEAQQSAAVNDPWGSSAPSSSGNAFDPFSAGPSSSANVDPWAGATLAAPPAPAAPASSPWSAPSEPAAAPEPVVISRKDSFSDLFAASEGTSSSEPVSCDPWGNTAPASTANFDPFQTLSAQAPESSAVPAAAFEGFTTPSVQQQTFDPLAEFDNLHVSAPTAAATTPSPVSAPSMIDPFVLEPIPVNAQAAPMTAALQQTAVDSKAGNFLSDNMSSLIDINSLLPSKPVTNPYAMAKTGTSVANSTRNPFLQKAPALSLNELQGGGGSQNMFGDAPALNPSFAAPQQQPFFNGSSSMVGTSPFPAAQNPF